MEDKNALNIKKRILIDIDLESHTEIKKIAAMRNITIRCLVMRVMKKFINKEKERQNKQQ